MIELLCPPTAASLRHQDIHAKCCFSCNPRWSNNQKPWKFLANYPVAGVSKFFVQGPHKLLHNSSKAGNLT